MVLGFVGPMLIGAYENRPASATQIRYETNPNAEIFILSEIEEVR